MPTADLDLAAITARAAEAKRRVDYIACRVMWNELQALWETERCLGWMLLWPCV